MVKSFLGEFIDTFTTVLFGAHSGTLQAAR
jgi:hypothetical protein